MKIHHVTDEWDYTLGISPGGGSEYFLTFSILRQPERTPDFICNGIKIRSAASVELYVSGSDTTCLWLRGRDITCLWLRGSASRADRAEGHSAVFPTHSAAVKQLSYVYDSLRQYEEHLVGLSRVVVAGPPRW